MVSSALAALTPSSFSHELRQRVGRHLGDALDAVLVAQEVQHLLVEHLPAELPRLHQDHAAVLGVGVVAEVGALVDEALAVGVDHHAEGVVVLLEVVADREVAELRRVAIPGHRVAARPVAGRHGVGIERHLDAVARVEARAAHLGQLPAGAHVARAPFGIGLEAARRQHDVARPDRAGLTAVLHAHALHAVVVGDEADRPGVVERW